MVELLAERGIAAEGVRDTTLYHLVGTETMNLRHPDRREFSPPFSRLSPYMVCEILDLTDPQQTRYWQAYENCKTLLRELGIYPQRMMGRVEESHERRLERLDEFSEGYPGMSLAALLDVVSAFLHAVERQEGNPRLYSPEFRDSADRVMRRIKQSKADSAVSWRALRARLFRLMRLNVFDSRKPGVQSIDYNNLVRPGVVSIIDLSDMEAPDLQPGDSGHHPWSGAGAGEGFRRRGALRGKAAAHAGGRRRGARGSCRPSACAACRTCSRRSAA